jgi:KaiC/GvpD/RAD55 family RecA-like ATPase
VELVEEYYSTDPDATYVDLEILKSRLTRKYPKHEELLNAWLSDIDPVSIPNVLREYAELRLKSVGEQLGTKLINGDHNQQTLEVLQQYQFLLEKKEEALYKARTESEIAIGMSYEEVFNSIKPENLIKVYPKILNEHLDGGIPKGSHVVVFARPETGKSMFCINMAAKFLEDGARVLYLGNEDPMRSMLQRFLCRMSGKTKQEFDKNPGEYYEVAKAKGYDNLVFISMSPGSISEVGLHIANYKPDVVVVDQMRNLHTPKALTKVESYEYIAQSLRSLYKKHDIVGFSITQAGDSAHNKLVLEQGDVDFSNTGIPATADLMIGIGCNPQYEQLNQRMISLPKNKVSGMHASFAVRVNPQLSMVLSV